MTDFFGRAPIRASSRGKSLGGGPIPIPDSASPIKTRLPLNDLLRSSVSIAYSAMRPNRCSHGPQDWSRRLVGFSFVKIEWMIVPDRPCLGWRLWVYTRAAAWTLDLYLEAPADMLNFGERMAWKARQRRESERLWTLLRARPGAAAS